MSMYICLEHGIYEHRSRYLCSRQRLYAAIMIGLGVQQIIYEMTADGIIYMSNA